MSDSLSSFEVTNNAIVIKHSENRQSDSLLRYQEAERLATEAYRASIYQTAAQIRSKLVMAGVDVSVEEALRRASAQQGQLVYITTLQKKTTSLREKLFGVTNG